MDTTYKLKCKMSIDAIYLLISLGEMYARINPDNIDNIAPLVQATMRAGLETVRQAENSDLISIEIFQHEMVIMMGCLFTIPVIDTFFTAFRNKELTYYAVRGTITADDLQGAISTLESFFKEAYSKLPADAIH